MPTRLTDIAKYEGSGETIAVGAGEWQVSYRDLDRRCDGIAAAFAALGYRPGERIVLLLPSIPDFAAGYLGAHRAGLVTVPVNPLVGEDEFGRILTAMAPRAIVGPMPGAAPFPAIQKLAALRDTYAPDALILYSGARGKEAEETASNALPFTEFHDDGGPAPSVIRAWSVSTETTWSFPRTPLKPRLRLRADVASGDRNPSDGKLGTFNALVLKAKYFGELTPIGLRNIVHVHPSVEFDLGKGVSVELVAARFWRQSRGDGIYDIPGQLIRPAGGSRARHIGDQVEISAGWQANELLSFSLSLSAFGPGDFIRDTGPARTIHMMGAEAMFKF